MDKIPILCPWTSHGLRSTTKEWHYEAWGFGGSCEFPQGVTALRVPSPLDTLRRVLGTQMPKGRGDLNKPVACLNVPDRRCRLGRGETTLDLRSPSLCSGLRKLGTKRPLEDKRLCRLSCSLLLIFYSQECINNIRIKLRAGIFFNLLNSFFFCKSSSIRAV